MAVNVLGAVDVPLSLFAGLNTELSPSDIPEGVSPDCQDVVFLPGSVSSRPGLHKLFSSALTSTPTVTYAKTYIQSNDNPLTLLLDSNGVLWSEDVTNSPGTVSQLTQIAANSYAQSVTHAGKEYLAFSDGLHGTYAPLHYDGTFLDRVTQDGPGSNPCTVADFSNTVNISSITQPAGVAISQTYEVGNVATITTSSAHGLKVGDTVLISGVTVAGYNGTWVVTAAPSTTTFTYTNTAVGLTNSSGGNAFSLVATVTVSTAHTAIVGDPVVIVSNSSTAFNNSNNSTNTPAFWTVTSVVSPTVFTFTAISGGNTGTATGTASIGGLISAGSHQMVLLFLNRDGYIPHPSPPIVFSSAGQRKIQISNIPLGPANVTARILAFTGSSGGNFFYIPVPALASAVGSTQLQQVSTATVILDNTSTSVTVDFADNTLFASQAIDIPGNNLFAQVVLGPCLGFFSFAGRLFAWGERNKIQNLQNMGFYGGFLTGTPTVPLGWTIDTAGGALSTTTWVITGDGTASAKGRITQAAYQDVYGIPILTGNTQYTFRCFAKVASAQTGNLVADFFSASSGVLATATINLNTVTTKGSFVQADFSAKTPITIPTDTVLRVSENNLPNAQTVTLSELEIINTATPFQDNLFRASYVNNPEAFDGVTGLIGPDTDSSPLRCCSQLRNTLYIKTSTGLHSTQDNGTGEPSTWTVNEISRKVGALSFRSGDPGQFGTGDTGEGWELIASRGGLYIFDGGNLYKVSQEIQSIWETINWAAQHTIWIKNDSVTRRCYLGIPLGSAVTPNFILVLDYRELDTAPQISASPPIHISFTGKMIASDMSRKWTKWNVQANCGEIILRPSNAVQFCLGAGNGLALGTGSGFGNLYFLDSTKLTDDDYGLISPSYTTYFFINHDSEQALGVGSHRKLYRYLASYVSGTGYIQITPYAASLSNPWPSTPKLPLASVSGRNDLEIGINVTAERVAFKFISVPLQGQTDNSFNLQKLIVSLQMDPWSPIRGAF